jgi:pseudaminic acid biosynthesis-associated methylase
MDLRERPAATSMHKRRTRPPEEVQGSADAGRLENLWRGEFGDSYTERNATAAEGRRPFWQDLLAAHPCERVLEVGCNLGANLTWISSLVPPHGLYAIEVNEGALRTIHKRLPTTNAVEARARQLPFRDQVFDLVFTTGVLIHQPPALLPLVMREIVRCSRRYVLAGEYFAETLTEVPYRGVAGALYKQDFGALYRRLFPELRQLTEGFLPRGSGWDDVTYWLFEKA